MLDEIVSALWGADRSMVVVTGAGVSLASGIPTFRGTDPGAVWAREVTERGTLRYFQQDPVDSWRWYLDRFALLEGRHPNPAHSALAELEAWQVSRGGAFLLVTQNVDRLHALAGSMNLLEVHGRNDRVRCVRAGCLNGEPTGLLPRDAVEWAAFRSAPSPATLPRCPACGALLRPHLLWFDEPYLGHQDYGFRRLLDACRAAQMVLFVGTSFSVGATGAALDLALLGGARLASIDPSGQAPIPEVLCLAERAEEALPKSVARLRNLPGS